MTDAVQKKIVDARTTLGLYIIQLNYPVEAKKAVEPIIDTALKIGHKGRLSQIYSIIGTYEFEVEEDFTRALKHFKEALTISERVKDIPSLFFANDCLGLALYLNCEFENAADHFEKALEINVAANSAWGISAMKTFLSLNSLAQGNIDLAYQISGEALRMAEESGDTYSKWIEKGIEADEKNGMRFTMGQDYASYAELFKRAGDLSIAKQNFGKAIEIFKECGANGWVDKYEKDLAELPD